VTDRLIFSHLDTYLKATKIVTHAVSNLCCVPVVLVKLQVELSTV